MSFRLSHIHSPFALHWSTTLVIMQEVTKCFLSSNRTISWDSLVVISFSKLVDTFWEKAFVWISVFIFCCCFPVWWSFAAQVRALAQRTAMQSMTTVSRWTLPRRIWTLSAWLKAIQFQGNLLIPLTIQPKLNHYLALTKQTWLLMLFWHCVDAYVSDKTNMTFNVILTLCRCIRLCLECGITWEITSKYYKYKCAQYNTKT